MARGEDFPHLLSQTTKILKSEIGEKLDEALQNVLHENLKRSRLQQYFHLNPEGTTETYISQVTHRYKVDHCYLKQVQQQKNNEVWEPLLGKIRQWSYRFLGRWKLDDPTRMIYTSEIAQEASLAIIHSHFPYDCEFDAWACKITQHVCSQYMKHYDSSFEVGNLNLLEIDEWYLDYVEEQEVNLENHIANKLLLLNAITQLSDEKESVIKHFYFEDKPLQQIATEMNVSANTVYKRHFDALQQLRRILESN